MKITHKKTKDNYLEVEVLQSPKINIIKNLKSQIEQSESEIEDDQLKILREKREQSGCDRIKRAKLFIECLDRITETISNIDSNESKELQKYLNKVDNQDLRILLEKYNSGYGTYYPGEKIKDIVDSNEVNKTIDIFFSLFGEE